jgi:glycosyltransferase involved in cell wall biosynthesis
MSEVQMPIKMPRIGIDFHVVDGIFQGSRTFVLELFSEVIRISPNMHFVLFLENTDLLREFSPIFSGANVELIHMPHADPFKRLCWQLPLLQRKYRLDILHNQYILPIPSFSAGIVTIHDILFESHPQYFTVPFRIRSAILVRLSAWRAKHIFTISEFSKREVMSRYGVHEENISIIYCGVDRTKFFAGDAGIDIVESRGLASKGYLLSVGRLEPRKNHVALLRAYSKLQSIHLPLIIIGQPDFGFDEVFQLIRDLHLESRVRILSNVNDEELPAFYRHAKLFVYPSWAEGFGMPPLEAMASGVPVISSDSTSIPEVVGDAAMLVSPDDIDALAKAIDQFLSDPVFYSEMQQRGFKQVKAFQWSTEAEKVKAIYLNTLA